MGGLMLYENDVMTKVLGIEEFEGLVSEKIDWPAVSEREIQDKSKGDFVSKGLAVLQTTWLTIQCIARRIVGLSITQLELATLAFAVLNIILYMVWWHKPLGVACPVPVHLRHPTTSEASLEPPLLPLFHHHSSAFACFRAYFFKKFKEEGLFAIVHIFVLKPFTIIVEGVCETVFCDTIPDSPAQFSVPTFDTPHSPDDEFVTLLGPSIGILFGGIHCIAWSFDFPSVPEIHLENQRYYHHNCASHRRSPSLTILYCRLYMAHQYLGLSSNSNCDWSPDIWRFAYCTPHSSSSRLTVGSS